MIVFVCDNNACHSIMAQAIFEHLCPQLYAQSAGKYTSFVRHEVRVALDEIGILSKGYHSKDEVAIDWTDVQLVVQLCDPAWAPFTPSRIPKRQWLLPDPLAAPKEERLEACRALRDELERRIKQILPEFQNESRNTN